MRVRLKGVDPGPGSGEFRSDRSDIRAAIDKDITGVDLDFQTDRLKMQLRTHAQQLLGALNDRIPSHRPMEHLSQTFSIRRNLLHRSGERVGNMADYAIDPARSLILLEANKKTARRAVFQCIYLESDET
jgi:hypothetical protein